MFYIIRIVTEIRSEIYKFSIITGTFVSLLPILKIFLH